MLTNNSSLIFPVEISFSDSWRIVSTWVCSPGNLKFKLLWNLLHRSVLDLLGHLFQECMQIKHVSENKCLLVMCVCVSIIREEIMSFQPEMSLGNLLILGEENKRIEESKGKGWEPFGASAMIYWLCTKSSPLLHWNYKHGVKEIHRVNIHSIIEIILVRTYNLSPPLKMIFNCMFGGIHFEE